MAKRPTVKQIAARKKFVAAVRAGKFRTRKTKRKAPAKRKSVKRNPARKKPKKTYLIRTTYADGSKAERYITGEGMDAFKSAQFIAGNIKKKPGVRGVSVTQKHAPARKTVKKNPAKQRTFGLRKYVIRATYAGGKGYRYYYLRGDDWRARKGDATRYSKQAGRRRIVAIKSRLEPEITIVTLELA